MSYSRIMAWILEVFQTRGVLLEIIELIMIIGRHMLFFKRVLESLVGIIDQTKIIIIQIILTGKNLILNLKRENSINLQLVKICLFQGDMHLNLKCLFIHQRMKASKFSKLIIKRDLQFQWSQKEMQAIK